MKNLARPPSHLLLPLCPALCQTRRAFAVFAFLSTLFLSACTNDGPELESTPPEVADAIAKSKTENPDAWKRRVIVIGMDSCDPDLLEDLIRRGKASNFARIRRDGAHGVLASLTPLLSPVVWTTISTGMAPERHGILDFVTKGADGQLRPVSSRMRQADTVWELVARAGEPVGVVGWLVSYPAEPINGFLVSERIGRLAYEADRFGRAEENDAHAVWPPEFAADIARKDRVTIDDLPLSRLRSFVDVTEDEYAAAYTDTFKDPRNLLGGLRLTMADAETYRRVGERLYREERPRLFFTYFNAMDALSHMFMPLAKPKMPQVPTDVYLRYKDVIEANYMWHDRVLGEYLDLADENTTVIVVSDHGFKHGALRTPDSSAFAARTGAMWHRRYGVIYAIGGGVKSGHRITGASVWDVAPTILAAMGYPVPKDMPGNVLTDVFEDGLPHETVPTWFGEQRRLELARKQAGDTHRSEAELSPEEQEELAKMRANGYIPGSTEGEESDVTSTALNLASRLLATGQHARAIAEYEKLLTNPEDAAKPRVVLSLANARILLAGALKKRGRVAEANKQLLLAQKALATPVANAADGSGAVRLRARLERERGNLDVAEALAREAVEREAHQASTWVELAEILRQKMEQAQVDTRAAIVAGKRDVAARRNAAAARFQIEAADALRQALHREPRQFHVLTELAHLELASMPPAGTPPHATSQHLVAHAETALGLLDRALELIPRSPRAFNNRAIALLRMGIGAAVQGRNADTREFLEAALDSSDQALEIQPKRVKSWSNRAYILWKLGDLPTARESAMKARESDPTYVFNPLFVAALASAGTPLPPPSAAVAPQQQGE